MKLQLLLGYFTHSPVDLSIARAHAATPSSAAGTRSTNRKPWPDLRMMLHAQ
jgi:hypothetical protein